jgi:hypothetical protein
VNIPNPRNASEALQQARVLERANRLFADGYRAAYVEQDDVILVTNEEQTTYRVGVVFEDCTCPFYVDKQYCKHALGAQRLLLLSNNERREMAEAEECGMDLVTYRRFKDPFCEE